MTISSFSWVFWWFTEWSSKESKEYASFDLHGIKPSMQENGLKYPVKLSLKSHLCE